jgi:hypothetical protein
MRHTVVYKAGRMGRRRVPDLLSHPLNDHHALFRDLSNYARLCGRCLVPAPGRIASIQTSGSCLGREPLHQWPIRYVIHLLTCVQVDSSVSSPIIPHWCGHERSCAGEQQDGGASRSSVTTFYTLLVFTESLLDLNNTYQEYELGSFPYTFDLLASPPSYPVGTVPAKDVPPAGYNVVGLDVGTHTPGFALVSRTLARPGTPFRGFAACAVDGIEPYFTVGPQVQLFWRNATAGVPGARCAEIELRAVAA